MDDMLALHPVGEKPNSLFLYVFLRKLPGEMMDQLTACDYGTPRDLAAAADKLWDSRRSRGRPLCSMADSAPVSVVSPPSRSPSPSTRRPAARKDNSSRNRQRAATPGPSGFCRLHAKWGEDARQCYPPCCWPKNGQRTGRRN